MVRRRWLIAQIAFVAMLGPARLPGRGLGTSTDLHHLADSGWAFSRCPEDSRRLGSLWFRNTDTVTHTVVFANGSCSIQVAPDTGGQCPGELSFPRYVGDYAYTVDGTGQAQLVIEAVGRSVSLGARSHADQPRIAVEAAREAPGREQQLVAAQCGLAAADHRAGTPRPLPRFPPDRGRHRRNGTDVSRRALPTATCSGSCTSGLEQRPSTSPRRTTSPAAARCGSGPGASHSGSVSAARESRSLQLPRSF